VPYHVGTFGTFGDLVVGSSPGAAVATLTIEPGMTLRFKKDGTFNVEVYTDAERLGVTQPDPTPQVEVRGIDAPDVSQPPGGPLALAGPAAVGVLERARGLGHRCATIASPPRRRRVFGTRWRSAGRGGRRLGPRDRCPALG
jgi:hypothetical protein